MRKGRVLWLFGPSGAGKSTLTKALLPHIPSVVLDGDHMRSTVSKDLGFSVEDRTTHLERMAHIAKHLSDSGVDVICAFITPTDKIRSMVEGICPNIIWVWCMSVLKVGRTFFECPTDNNYVFCPTVFETVEETTNKVLEYLNNRPLHFYLGRFQPFHNGHQYIIRTSLDDNIPVLVGVKDMLPDSKNPYSTEQVVQTIEEYYKGYDVEVIIVPNITSVRYGRKVGWNVEQIEVPDHIASISATRIREGEQ